MAVRREVVFSMNEGRYPYPVSADVTLTITRRGVELNGYYDTLVGIGNTRYISWAELDAARRRVIGKEAMEAGAGKETP